MQETGIPFHGQWYSDIIVYDERKKYYYMWARKNRPFLDDEIRNMGLGLLDQTRRSLQHIYGDVGSPTEPSSNKLAVGANSAFKIVQATNPVNNFTIKGGSGSVENPAVLFAKGFYIFLTGDLDYQNQSSSLPNTSDGYTETPIPLLTYPLNSDPDRLDVIYIDLHFEEASAAQGSCVSEYTDLNLRNPIVGTETANRARAVFDIRVWEDWRFKDRDGNARLSPVSTIDETIFTLNDFLGSDTNDTNPVNNDYRIPIAFLIRRSGNSSINPSTDVIDILDLYDKRMYDLQEITYKLNHGGFTQRDVNETQLFAAFTGLTGTVSVIPRYSYAKVDESAYATGANDGIGTKAFNSDSVTPRVLDDSLKFAMGSLLVGRETGSITYPIDSVTGPEQLYPGELVAQDISAKSIYVGYDRGVTGVRGYTGRININMHGMTSGVGLAIINTGFTGIGATGVACFTVTTNENSIYVDYEGRIGVDTNEPGWSGPSDVWETTTRFTGTYDVVDIALDVNASTRTTQHAFIDKDLYVQRDSYGPSWKIPGTITRDDPALIGITGMPRIGITGSPASVQVVPGIAVIGLTGTLEGYTGTYGFYEAYDANGERVYTIGSKGDPFDRQVLSLYGTSETPVYISETGLDFLHLSLFSNTPIAPGDTCVYNIALLDKPTITRAVGISTPGLSGLYEIVQDINYGAGFCYTGIFQKAIRWNTSLGGWWGTGDTGPYAYTGIKGEADGAAINYEDPSNGQYLHLLVRSMSELDLDVQSVDLTLYRMGYPDLPVDFTKSGYFGSGGYGGDVIDLRFVKFDLGEAAQAFMFNGDVYFNGGGYLNKVTFSPMAIFRDNVYVYGRVMASSILIQLAQFTDLQVSRDAQVARYLSVMEGVAEGFEPYGTVGLNALKNLVGTNWDTTYHIKNLINGGLRATNINLHAGQNPDLSDFGITWELQSFRMLDNIVVKVVMNGPGSDLSTPFGIHLIDSRQTPDANKYNTFVFDGNDGNLNTPTLRNILLWVKGDIQVGTSDSTSIGGILAKRITLGTDATAIDQQYILSLKSGAAYIENLTVKSIQYDATNPTSAAFFTNPQNIIIIQRGQNEVTYNKTQGILRTKQFSVDTYTNPPINLQNTTALGTTAFDYTNIPSNSARWAHDTLSFTRDIISFLSQARGDDTITTPDFNVPNRVIPGTDTWKFYRDNFSRIIVANMGSLRIKWDGYVDGTKETSEDPDGAVIPWVNEERDRNLSGGVAAQGFANNPIKSYVFSSSLFKFSQDGNNSVDWSNNTNNFIANIRASFNDSSAPANTLYSFNKTLGIYIPEDSSSTWKVRERRITTGAKTYYERLLYYPYFSKIDNFNVVAIDQQYPLAPGYMWQAAIYPRIVRQTFYGIAGQQDNASSENKTYEADWEVDLVIYPTTIGTCYNLTGDLLISFM
jgi:hypothetical protein